MGSESAWAQQRRRLEEDDGLEDGAVDVDGLEEEGVSGLKTPERIRRSGRRKHSGIGLLGGCVFGGIRFGAFCLRSCPLRKRPPGVKLPHSTGRRKAPPLCPIPSRPWRNGSSSELSPGSPVRRSGWPAGAQKERSAQTRQRTLFTFFSLVSPPFWGCSAGRIDVRSAGFDAVEPRVEDQVPFLIGLAEPSGNPLHDHFTVFIGGHGQNNNVLARRCTWRRCPPLRRLETMQSRS